MDVLRDPLRNKGTAFSEAERDALGLHGLLPPAVASEAAQVSRILENFARKPSDLERYIYLTTLADRNETLFYRVVIDHIETMMPIIYTPTVGEACQRYGHIFQRPRGLFLSRKFRGRMAEVLGNWPRREVEVIVVTDGERILGLGDLGAHGMGIPVGKLSLYTACAGIDPWRTLPIMLDAGTDNVELRDDPLYIGDRLPRLRGAAYDALLDEFVTAVADRFPGVLLQFEDFATANAFALLDRYRERLCCFNDDIQGTAAVAVAGLLAAGRITGRPLTEQTLLFVGAGQAAVGIADLFTAALVAAGIDEPTARRRSWLIDSRGLVTAARESLPPHKRRYAHQPPGAEPAVADLDLVTAIDRLEPTALIGVSGQPGAFSEAALAAMAAHHPRPIVFALSNPTSRSETDAATAYRATGGRAIFASGSPFAPVEVGGRTLVPGQGNNAYVFPGVGLGVVASGARRVTDEMFLAAAEALADEVSDDDLERGSLYPSLRRIREVSAAIAVRVAEVAWRRRLTASPRPSDPHRLVASRMYDPAYDAGAEQAPADGPG